MLRSAVLFVVAALAAPAQFPMNTPIGECLTEDPAPETTLQSKYTVPGSVVFIPGNVCTAFTYGGGWEETIELHLGEGADEYEDLIERAVEVWNEAIKLPTGDPLIEIVTREPENYEVPRSFWADPLRDWDSDNDGESVIYFAPSSDDDSRSWGITFVWLRSTFTRGRRIAEADIFINTHDEEEVSPDTLMLAKKIADVDRSYGAYVLVNKTYDVILHEIGHAIGLRHVAVSGNIMSRYFGGGGIGQWAAPMALEIENAVNPRRLKFVYANDTFRPYTRVPPQVWGDSQSD